MYIIRGYSQFIEYCFPPACSSQLTARHAAPSLQTILSAEGERRGESQGSIIITSSESWIVSLLQMVKIIPLSLLLFKNLSMM
jgi:hypothetical protein